MRFLLLFKLLLLSSAASYAAEDHPLISAYPGADIYRHAVTHYTEIHLPTHKLERRERFEGTPVTGKQTGHIYRISGSVSARQVAENYLDAVKRLDGQLLLQCHSDCGNHFSGGLLANHWARSIFVDMLNFSQGNREYYYILAQVGPDEHPTYLQWFITQPRADRVEYGQIISEPQQLQLGLVAVDTSALMAQMEQTAPSASLGEDRVQGGDHPLISRYEGARLTHRTVVEYAEVRLATGIADDNRQIPHLALAGRSTLLHYQASRDQSTLQVFSNYKSALQQAGFTLLFHCEHQACGNNQMRALWQDSPNRNRFHGLFGSSTNARDDYRMLTAHKNLNNADVYLSIYIKKLGEGARFDIAHDIVEISTLQTDRVSIDLSYLQDELSRSGKVVLHGLHFATDSATILPESNQALSVIVAYLQQHADQGFYVVGHTDNTGSHDHNMRLSKARANSIRQVLVDHGIAAERLLAEGVGPMSPQQHNASEAGKASNRRVELVLR